MALDDFDEGQAAKDSGRDPRVVTDMLANAAGIWSWTLQSDCERIRVYGDTSRIFKAPPTRLSEIVGNLNPDDQANLRKIFGRAAREGGSGELDCRLLSPHHRWLHFHVTFQTEPSPEGGFLLRGVSQDVTHQMDARDPDFRNAERLRIALGSARAAVCELDFKAKPRRPRIHLLVRNPGAYGVEPF